MPFKSKLSEEKIKELEAKYGEHKFCYQCGNPSLTYFDKSHTIAMCGVCGSSDLDE